MGAELTAFDYRTRTKGNKAGLVMWPATRQLKIHAVSWRNCSGKTTTLAQQNIGFGLNSTFQHHASPSVCLIASKKPANSNLTPMLRIIIIQYCWIQSGRLVTIEKMTETFSTDMDLMQFHSSVLFQFHGTDFRNAFYATAL